MKNQKKNLKKAAVISSALLSGSVIGLSPLNAGTGSLFDYNALGTGAELRSGIIDMNKTMKASKAAESTSTIKFSELKCGEGSCGEGKKEEKKSEGKEASKKKSETKSSEAKCGEGEKKEEKKSEAKKSESKSSESKCGEGKCGK